MISTQQKRGLFRGGTVDALDEWVADARSSNICGMRRFARTLRQDMAAVITTASTERFMKTLKMEAVYLAAYETFEEVIADLPRSIDYVYNSNWLHSVFGHLSPVQFED